MRGDAVQTFKNINGPTPENLGEILAVFRRKYVKPQTMATAEHKSQKLVFNSANQKLVDFLDDLQKLANDALGIAAHAIIEQFIGARMPPQPEKSINQAHLENGTYKQIVSHLEKQLELNDWEAHDWEAPDEVHIKTVSHNKANTNADRPKLSCHHCKQREQNRNQCRLFKRQTEQSEDTQNNPRNKNSGANFSIANNNTNKNEKVNNNKDNIRAEIKPKTVSPPCETCGKTNHSTEKCYYGANAANRPTPRHRRPERQNHVQERANQNDSNGTIQAAAQNWNWKSHVFTPELWFTYRRLLNFHQSLKLSSSNLKRLV